jgi:AI-2 transport protein TqsA
MSTASPGNPRDLLRTVALTLFILIAVVVILVQGRAILVPIAIAVVIWYIIVALSQAIARLELVGRRLPRFWCGAAAIGCVFLAGFLFVGLVRQSIAALQQAAPRYQERLEEALHEGGDLLGLGAARNLEQIAQDIDLSIIAEYFLSSAKSLVFDGIMIFFYVVFLLVQQKYMAPKLRGMVNDPARRQSVDGVIQEIHADLRKYIGVMSFLALVTGLITYLVFTLVGIDFPILWSVVIGLFSFVPTIGTAFGIALPAVLALLQFGASSEFAIVLVTLGAAQILLNNVAQPALMGRSLNLSPFLVLVTLSIWASIWGIVGAVLSVPITVAMAIIFSRFPSTRWVAVLLSSEGKAR